jgi:isopenicillin N synthase-like dioxygenase
MRLTVSEPLTMSAPLSLAEISVRHLHEPSVIEQLIDASKNVGFIRLVDLDLSIDTAQIFHTSKTFFDLEESEKSACATQSYVPNNPNAYRGYFPVIPNSDTFKEGFEFGWRNFTPTKPNHPLHEASVFPHSLSKNWQSDAQAYFEDMLTLGNKLLNAYEIGLGLNEGRLTSLFSNSMSTLRFIRYPERTETASISETLEQQGELTFSTPSHADSGILTLLLQDNTGC